MLCPLPKLSRVLTPSCVTPICEKSVILSKPTSRIFSPGVVGLKSVMVSVAPVFLRITKKSESLPPLKVLLPAPPSSKSVPAPPESVSSPLPPCKRLESALPVSVSLPSPPKANSTSPLMVRLRPARVLVAPLLRLMVELLDTAEALSISRPPLVSLRVARLAPGATANSSV